MISEERKRLRTQDEVVKRRPADSLDRRIDMLIVDIDNTLCVNEGPFGPLSPDVLKEKLLSSDFLDGPSDESRRNAELDRIASLTPDLLVCDLIRQAADYTDIIYVSGRPAWLKETTLDWLRQHYLPKTQEPNTGAVYLRAEGDKREATDFKCELVKYILSRRSAPHPDRVAVLDDSPSIRTALSADLGVTAIDPHSITSLSYLSNILQLSTPSPIVYELEQQVNHEISRFETKRYFNRRIYVALFLVQVVTSSATTILIGWHGTTDTNMPMLKNIALVTSGIAAVMAILLGTSRAHDLWLNYTNTVGRLKAFRNRLRLLHRSETDIAAIDQLFDRFQDILSQSNKQWDSVTRRKSSKSNE